MTRPGKTRQDQAQAGPLLASHHLPEGVDRLIGEPLPPFLQHHPPQGLALPLEDVVPLIDHAHLRLQVLFLPKAIHGRSRNKFTTNKVDRRNCLKPRKTPKGEYFNDFYAGLFLSAHR